MSEQHHEHVEKQETLSSTEHKHNHEAHHISTAEKAAAEAEQSETLKKALREVDQQSEEKDKLIQQLKAERSQESDDQEFRNRPVGSELKKSTFNKEMKHVRRQLNKTDRLGSRVVHQPIIRAVSEVSSKTITRPSGLLGGGIVAFLGTTTYLYLTKHIGLKYNYSMFLFLLLAGFVLGVLIEAMIRLFRGRRTA